MLGLGKLARQGSARDDDDVSESKVPLPLRGYEAFVSETLMQYPRLRATRLLDMLAERGYAGSVRTVRRFVRLVRPLAKSKVFLRVEPLVAEQSQVNWGYIDKLHFPGGTRQLWVFVIVLAYSRAMRAELVLDLTAALTRARRGLLRRRHAAVALRQPQDRRPQRRGDAVRFHPELLSLAAELCGAPLRRAQASEQGQGLARHPLPARPLLRCAHHS